MTRFSITKALGLALSCAALAFPSHSACAADIRANAGTTFVTVFGAGGAFTHTVNGVADVSLLGTCRVRFDVVGQITPTADVPIGGTLTLTATDGTILKAAVKGAAEFGPAGFGKFYYHVTFTGGTGPFAGVRGTAEIEGVFVLTSEAGDQGTATWRLKGIVLQPNQASQ